MVCVIEILFDEQNLNCIKWQKDIIYKLGIDMSHFHKTAQGP